MRQPEELRVLVVEDQPVMRQLIRTVLRQMRIRDVTEAENGPDALAVFSGKIDMIVCDWVMPEMSGLELLQRVRAVDADIPFLMVTGNADADAIRAAVAAGVSAYIVKPFTPKQLESKLRVMIERAQTRRAA
ncbi:MAG TPA: response regulator [Alphaproteobacteria bacterium]